jgi:hypothetical protein
MKITPEHISSVRGSTTTDAHQVAAYLERTLPAQAGRSRSMSECNKARAAAQQSALDAAVLRVLGAAPLSTGYGVPKAISLRIRKEVKAGTLSSTLGHPNEPSIRDLRKSLQRLANVASPVLARHPEPMTSTYSSASIDEEF